MRPLLLILAGVNGAGKSSIGGSRLRQAGLSWFNPDTFARELLKAGMPQDKANGLAWTEGMRQLDEALANATNYAFETTLGGRSVTKRVFLATATHRVRIWFCGLESPERHIARVALRVRNGGHPIPESKIRERWDASRTNLIALLPHLDELQVFDNSADAQPGQPVPEPKLLLWVQRGKRTYPSSLAQAAQTPKWAQPILEAAFEMDPEN